jgi:hypothetical protein
LTLAVTIITLSVAAVVLTVLVDPYRFFGTAPVAGWTSLKPRASQQSDLAKTYMLARARPTTLLLGNSRVEVGLDPGSSGWPAGLRPVFNAALAGHGLFSALLFLQDDLALKPPKLVVLGVDFQDFIQSGNDSSEPLENAAERRMLADRSGTTNGTREIQVWADAITSTLSINAVTDSVTTLLLQNPSRDPTLTPDGFNPLHDYDYIVRHEGAYNLFAQKLDAYEAQYRVFHPSDFRDRGKNPQFRYLMAIARACAKHRIRLIILTYPYHARYFAMLHALNLWPSFVSWKRALNRSVDDMKAEPGSEVRLFDFAQESAVSREPVPPPGDRRTQMRWYWEAGHYKSELGDRLVTRMMER